MPSGAGSSSEILQVRLDIPNQNAPLILSFDKNKHPNVLICEDKRSLPHKDMSVSTSARRPWIPPPAKTTKCREKYSAESSQRYKIRPKAMKIGLDIGPNYDLKRIHLGKGKLTVRFCDEKDVKHCDRNIPEGLKGLESRHSSDDISKTKLMDELNIQRKILSRCETMLQSQGKKARKTLKDFHNLKREMETIDNSLANLRHLYENSSFGKDQTATKKILSDIQRYPRRNSLSEYSCKENSIDPSEKRMLIESASESLLMKLAETLMQSKRLCYKVWKHGKIIGNIEKDYLEATKGLPTEQEDLSQ